MVLNQYKKAGIVAAIFLVIVGGLWWRDHSYEQGPIYSFNAQRDTKAILDIFDKNWYWLIANDDSSPAFMFKYLTPKTNPLYFGKMIVKVLRHDDRLAGFVTYYKTKPHEWHLLFLAVDNDFRGHGYGRQLAEYAMNDMINQGAERIWLLTRLENVYAQKIYQGLGFVEFDYYKSGYIYFEYIP